MNRMTGFLISLGAILLLVVFAALWPDVEDGLEVVEALMENRTLSTFYLLCGIVAFTMMQSGLILLSRQLIGQVSGAHAQWLTVANIGFMISVAVMYGSAGLDLGAMELYAGGNPDQAALLNIVGVHVGNAVWPWAFGGGMFVLGWASVSGALKPKSGADWLPGLLVIPGALFILAPFVNTEGWWFGSWIIMTLSLVIVGGAKAFRSSEVAN